MDRIIGKNKSIMHQGLGKRQAYIPQRLLFLHS